MGAPDNIPRHIRVTLAMVQRAFENDDYRALGTICEDIQPVADAAVSRVRVVKRERDQEIANRQAAHALLDAAGIPSAVGAACDASGCTSHLLHRIHTLIEERDGLRASFADGGVPVRGAPVPAFTGPLRGEGAGEPDPGPHRTYANGGIPIGKIGNGIPVFLGPAPARRRFQPCFCEPAITKAITYCGQPATVACDGRCDKAWGRQRRPTHPDGSMIGDDALGRAPIDPGTYEGRHAKPRQPWEKPNRWCVRECERCWMSPVGEPNATPVLPTFPSPDR